MRLRRRAFLQGTSLLLVGSLADECFSSALPAINSDFAHPDTPELQIGLITDLHYADKPPAGSRHYRETINKLTEATARLGSSKLDFVVELGDLIDAADSVEIELGYLKTIDREFAKLAADRHYVLGNHCVDTLYKHEFLGEVRQKESYYSFDRAGFHFVILDACFRSDGTPYGRKNFQWTDANIPEAELEWLKADLDSTDKDVVVFAHQRLDVAKDHSVRNNGEVRKILESSGRVSAVFQGHSHKNDLQQIGGIYYCTLVAMVEGSGLENNAYSILEMFADGTIRLSGFRKQANYRWPLES